MVEKKKSPVGKIIGGGCALFVLFIIVIAGCSAVMMSGGGGDDSPSTSSAPKADKSDSDETVVEDDETVEDDSDINVVADGLTRTPSIGMDGFEEQAQGEYVIVDVSITNSSGEEISISGDDFSLIGSDGTKYGVSSDLPITEDTPLIYETINPGNSASGYILFDVPEGTDISSMQYEALFSFDGPTEVALP